MVGETRNVFVSSENRDTSLYPNGNSYTLHITTPIKDISKVELLHASVPNSMYNLTGGSNAIAFSNTTSGIGDPLTYFSLPVGFYGATVLSETIQNAVSNTSNIVVDYLDGEGKFLFTRDISPDGPFQMKPATDEIAKLLGFDDTSTLTSTNVAVETDLNIPLYSDNLLYRGKEFIKSTNVVNLKTNEGVFLDIEELRTIFNEDAKAITGNTYSGQTMARSFGLIPMDVTAGAIKNFKKFSDYDLCIDYPNPIRKLDRLTVKWVNRNGQTLNFNGLTDNSFVLRFHTLRENLCL
tara:strand:- start:53 stop:934 length:882 start_codon:yes stop_codon:yes gene_type:complete